MNRKASIRRIVAEYGNNSQGGSSEYSTVPWMEYIEKATKPVPGTEQTINTLNSLSKNKATVPDSRGGGDPDVGESLINEVTDGLSMNKTQDTPPANENDSYRSDGDMMQTPNEMNRTSIKDEPGQGRDWQYWGARNRPDEGAGSPWGSNLYGEGVNVSNIEASVRTAAKKLNEILDACDHPKKETFKRSGTRIAPQHIPDEYEESTGLYAFKAPSEKGNSPYTVHVQFVKVDAPTKSLLDHPVLVSCDCPSFLQWGPQYYALKGGYMYSPDFRPKNMEPKESASGGRDKGLTYCKHLYAVATHLTNLGIDPDHTDKVEKLLTSIKSDPGALQLPELQEVEDKGDLLMFLKDPAHYAEFRENTLAHMHEYGVSEAELIDFVNGNLVPVTEEQAAEAIKKLNVTPEILILILIEYQKIKGSLASIIVNAAYPSVKDALH